MRTRCLPVLLLIGVLAGCGNEGSTPSDGPDAAGSAPKAPAVVTPTAMPTAIPVPAGPVSTRSAVTVLGKVGEPAQLCLGGVAESLPPQCGGPVLAGFDFDDHPGDFEEASNVRWGEFAITGTFDGRRFEVSKVVPADEFKAPSAPEDPDRFATPCPTPSGGWRVLDPEKTTEAAREATVQAAGELPDYAALWVDNSRNPMDGEQPKTIEDEYAMSDPTYTTINVQVTGDPEVAERVLRRTWGGALCVTRAKYTEKDLLEIQQQVNKLPGMLSSGPADQVLQVYVTYDDGTLQAWADSVYEPSQVRVSSALVPASG